MFYDNNISINFLECLGTTRSPSVIGDHASMILALVDKIRLIIEISDEEYVLLQKLDVLLRCVMQINPSESDLDLYIKDGPSIVQEFVKSFKLDPWNYCHIFCTHMRDDAISLKEIGMSVGMFSVSRIESLGSKLKRIMKYNTNHNWRDRDDRREHCLMQTIRYFLFTRSVDETLYGTLDDAGSESGDSDEDSDVEITE